MQEAVTRRSITCASYTVVRAIMRQRSRISTLVNVGGRMSQVKLWLETEPADAEAAVEKRDGRADRPKNVTGDDDSGGKRRDFAVSYNESKI